MDKQEVLSATEDALDTIEEKIESAEQVGAVVARNKTVVIVGAAVALVGVAAVSAFAGYKYAKKKLETKYADLSTEEIAEAKNYYARLYKVEEFATPAQAVAALIPEDEQNVEIPSNIDSEDVKEIVEKAVSAAERYSGGKTTKIAYNDVEKLKSMNVGGNGDITFEEVEEVSVTVDTGDGLAEVAHNVFTDANLDEWDYEREVALRSPERPYILTEQEYLLNDEKHDQTTLTYYAGDDVLADVQDRPIDDIERVVGTDNLVRFGQGSGNENIVFVRNERISTDFEIERSDGNFADEVGFHHSVDGLPGGGIRRFRMGMDG